MKLANLVRDGGIAPGLVVGSQILDLRAAAESLPQCGSLPSDILSMLQNWEGTKALLQGVAEDAVKQKDQLLATGALILVADAVLGPPLPNPGMVLSVGANYHEHLKEMNTATPKTPMAFYKSVASIIGQGEAIILPQSNPDMVDWEGEFSVVIGRPCHRVSAGEALDYVAGYTIVNDVSARDWVAPAFQAEGMMGQIVAWEHNILGKLFPTFCPMGPYMVTADEIEDSDNLNIETRLNGEVMQSSNTSDLVFNVPKIIEYYSQFLQFRPGDVITTGSPSGVGYGRDPKVFMKAGDVIEVEIEGIGILCNPIAAAAS